MSRKILEQELIEDLKKVSEKLNKFPTIEEYNKIGNFSSGPYKKIKLFIKISNDDLIGNLIDLKEKLGRNPKKDDLNIENGSKYSINSYRRAFGNLANALIASNLKPNQIRNITKEYIISEVNNLYTKLGKIPSFKDYRRYTNSCSFPTIKKLFGSWTKALIAADIPIKTSHKVSKQDIIDALEIWFKKNNRDISCLEYWKIRKARDRKEFPYSCNTIKKKFDNIGWEEIMWKCGFLEYKTINQFIKRSVFIGNDNQTYLSSIEKESADILYKMKQSNIIKNYFYEESVCNNKRWTCDFVIILNNDKKLWLEIDGLRNNRKDPYKSGHNEKIEFYKNNGFDFEILSYNNRDLGNSIIAMIEKRTIL